MCVIITHKLPKLVGEPCFATSSEQLLFPSALTVGPIGPLTVDPIGPLTVGPIGPLTVGPIDPNRRSHRP